MTAPWQSFITACETLAAIEEGQMNKRYPVEPGGGAPPVHVERDDTRCAQLWECYRTEQMSEAQWQGHLRDEPGLREWLDEQAKEN